MFIGDEWSVVEQMEHVDVWMLAAKGNELAVFGGLKRTNCWGRGISIYSKGTGWVRPLPSSTSQGARFKK
ncbi:MAG: hypothetical protein Ct9H300mP29_8920 [Candidatus Neomarinimicrobiota bacterium]|nr:MAG: hypothetical protein Ct9H300mP29_8920 [Candidatus Neomarinimicrobiota bacterium]